MILLRLDFRIKIMYKNNRKRIFFSHLIFHICNRNNPKSNRFKRGESFPFPFGLIAVNEEGGDRFVFLRRRGLSVNKVVNRRFRTAE